MTLRLGLQVQPRASTTGIVGWYGDALKMRVAAPPVDGEANAEIERFFAKLFGVPRADVRVIAGASSRKKMLQIEGIDAADLHEALRTILPDR